jgi:hypothetical protein
VLDLTGVRFAEPTLALRLAASEAVHAAHEAPFEIVPPRNRRVRDYLGRAGLARQMGLPERPGTEDVLMPITRLADPCEVEPAVEQLAHAAKQLPGALAGTHHALTAALGELGGNACSHGKNEHGAFALAQRFGSSRVVLAVGDLGVGIPVHLGEALRAREGEAQASLVAKALERGVSGAAAVDGEVRGNGLPSTIEKLRGQSMPTAEFGVWSGTGRVGIRMRPQPYVRRRINDVSSHTVGTWIEVVISSN